MTEPTIRDALVKLKEATDIIAAISARIDGINEIDPPRRLRFLRTDRVFSNLSNIACFAYMKKDQERRSTGSRKRDKTLPYGITDSASIRKKIENYRDRYTGRGKYGGRLVNGVWMFTQTIETICDFDPTYAELDEAAAYYTANPE